MSTRLQNTGLLLILALLLSGAGYYVTEVSQPKQLQQIADQQHEIQLRNARTEELLQMQAANESVAEGTLQKWRSRYKIVPKSIETPDIVQYLERLSSSGFQEITIDRLAESHTPDVSKHTFSLTGSAHLSSLVDFVWQLENNRDFYHVRDLAISHVVIADKNQNTGLAKRVDMAKFDFEIDVFFAGSDGLRAPEEELAAIPRSLLPIRQPAHDSFFPIIRTDLPPNDRGLVDLEIAQLVSIIGGSAVFEDSQGQHALSEGDEVYLGSIVKIDPIRAYVRASLNKGGVIDMLEIPLSAGDQLGLPRSIRRTPIQSGNESGGNRR